MQVGIADCSKVLVFNSKYMQPEEILHKFGDSLEFVLNPHDHGPQLHYCFVNSSHTNTSMYIGMEHVARQWHKYKLCKFPKWRFKS